LGRRKRLPKNRNWKISDFQIIQIWEEGSDSKKIGIGKSLIFKSFKFGKKQVSQTGIEKSLIFKSFKFGKSGLKKQEIENLLIFKPLFGKKRRTIVFGVQHQIISSNILQNARK
jgi:hypothetical protein